MQHIEEHDQSHERMTAEQELSAVHGFLSCQNDNRCQREFFNSFDWLVEKIIASYTPRMNQDDLDDVRQVILLSLVHSAEQYDPAKAKMKRFSDYARWMAWYALEKWHQKNTNITFSKRTMEELSKLNTYLRTRGNDTPSDERVCKDLRMTQEEYEHLKRAQELITVLSLQDFLSSRERKGDDKPFSHEEQIEPLREIEQRIALNDAFFDALEHARLTESEKEVLKMRYSIDYEQKYTQSQIAEQLNTSQMRISRLLKSALKKIEQYCRNFPNVAGSILEPP